MSERLTETSELLLRQIHPSFIQDGQISSQPFCPTLKDDHKLSLDRSSLTSAREARTLFIANGGRSEAVYCLSVEEFLQEDLPYYSDPLEASDGRLANPAHALA